MKFEDIEVGKIYSCGDDGLYKVIAKGTDWLISLAYSYNHYIASPIVSSKEQDNYLFEYWYEETEEWIKNIFNEELIYNDFNSLKNIYKE